MNFPTVPTGRAALRKYSTEAPTPSAQPINFLWSLAGYHSDHHFGVIDAVEVLVWSAASQCYTHTTDSSSFQLPDQPFQRRRHSR